MPLIDFYFNGAANISADFLAERGIRCALLDIDNTLAFDEAEKPAPGITDWITALSSAGIKACVLSNNSEGRIAAFAGLVGLPHVGNARKPLPSGVRRALKLTGCAAKETVVIGDQIFTDILSGKLAGCRTALVEPLGADNKGYFVVKRFLERPFWKAQRRKARGKKEN